MKTLIINRPNLNLVGKRKTEVYGEQDVDSYFKTLEKKYTFEVYQSNVEGEIINRLHQADTQNYNAILLNAGGYPYFRSNHRCD